jgi:S-formylglutathione hydrolase FrmB
MNRRHVVALLLLAASGCIKPPPPATPPAASPPEVLHTTYRAIGGISMGAIGASTIGLHHPEQFDAVLALGGPLDASYLSHMIESQLMGGFCTRQELEAQLARDPAGLNDPRVMTCTHDVPGRTGTEHTQSFNHWRFTTSGGHFTRSSYLNLFYDLTSAFGNLTSYNPDSSIAPQGIPAELVIHPPADLCQHPFRVKGKLADPSGQPIYNAEYNPQGLYDAITFCDGEEQPIYYCAGQTPRAVDFCAQGGAVVPQPQEAAYASRFCGAEPVQQATDVAGTPAEILAIYLASEGRHDPCRESTRPVRVALAFDLNGNGRRDFAEPIVFNAHERYEDVGTDGCDDAHEDGHGGCVSDPATSPFAQGVADPNGDNYDFARNPFGTQGDWKHEPGEPFADDGLDGVPGTHDLGEGDGLYTETPGLAKMRAYDPRSNYLALSTLQKHQLDLYLEGGIRDIFNFGVAAQVFAGAVRGADPSRFDAFLGFSEVFSTRTASEEEASPRYANWPMTAPNLLEVYGSTHPTPEQLQAGEGDHVGTANQALKRTGFLSSWVGSRWQKLPLPGGPNSGEHVDQGVFHSDALGADRDFNIYLPPGYDDPSQKDTRYPTLYLLHGYGGDSSQLTGISLLMTALMTDRDHFTPAANTRRYVVVFPSGRCCFQNVTTHARDCTLVHDGESGWESMCKQGSFFVNASGPSADNAPRYEDGLLDLIKYVDAHYRTLAPADVVER